jgi:hypothetical protein
MDQELKSYLEAMEERLAHRLEVNLAERIEKSENNLLRAFHGWARSMEIRVRGVSGVAVGFEERLSLVEERVSEVERRQAS